MWFLQSRILISGMEKYICKTKIGIRDIGLKQIEHYSTIVPYGYFNFFFGSKKKRQCSKREERHGSMKQQQQQCGEGKYA